MTIFDDFFGGGGLGVVSSALDMFGQSSANRQNVALAREQMGFQERLSNTAHQREVADLQAAGLNPMISAMKGQGASTPVGATPRVESVTKGAVASGAQAAVLASAIEKTKAETGVARSQEALNLQLAAKAEQDTRTGVATAGHLRALTNKEAYEVEHMQQKIRNLGIQYDLTHYEIQRMIELVIQARLENKNLEETQRLLIAETGSKQLANEFAEMEIPERFNAMVHARSFPGYRQNIAPFIHEFKELISSAAMLGAGGLIGRGLRAGVPSIGRRLEPGLGLKLPPVSRNGPGIRLRDLNKPPRGHADAD